MFCWLLLAIYAIPNIERYAENKFKTVLPTPPAISFASNPDNAKTYIQAVLQNSRPSSQETIPTKKEYGEFRIGQVSNYTTNGTKGVLIYNTHESTGQNYRTFVVGQWSVLEYNIANVLKEFHADYQSQYPTEQEKNAKKEHILKSMRVAIESFNDASNPLVGECEKKVDSLARSYPATFGQVLAALRLIPLSNVRGREELVCLDRKKFLIIAQNSFRGRGFYWFRV